MEKLITYFGIISCVLIGISLAQETVRVGDDLMVLPTPNPLINPEDKVDVTLTCTGSVSELSYYIKNRIEWKYIAANGTELKLTEGFYSTKEAKFLFGEADARFDLKYDTGRDGYMFDISITGVTHADNGIYRCSLLGEDSKVIDSKDLKLTVLHPVDKLTIEILTVSMERIADKRTPIIDGEAPLELTPGRYIVRCTAQGSNPAPVMSLFYNEARPTTNMQLDIDASGNRVKNQGSFEKAITVEAHTVPQTVLCEANIPGNHFEKKAAGLQMMVEVDKPTMSCGNFSAVLGDRYRKIMCNVTAEGKSSQALVCEKVSWFLGNKKQTIEYEQRWKDPSKVYDIMDSKCEEKGLAGLQVTLTIYEVKSAHFAEMYYLQYGVGDNAHRVAVQLNENTIAGASGLGASISVFICIVMATVVKHLTL